MITYIVNLLQLAASEPNHATPVLTDLQNLERSLLDVISMIDRVHAYVQGVIQGEIEGDPSIGRFLLDTLTATTEGLEKGKLESLFNIYVQVSCMVASGLTRPKLTPAPRIR